ncbi:MAG TPA: hypothetical protein VFB06_24705, partial [Streptosporangiaceae bacterium]|nr:hypothetical protein [Streptosporangiaceae bacterium]
MAEPGQLHQAGPQQQLRQPVADLSQVSARCELAARRGLLESGYQRRGVSLPAIAALIRSRNLASIRPRNCALPGNCALPDARPGSTGNQDADALASLSATALPCLASPTTLPGLPALAAVLRTLACLACLTELARLASLACLPGALAAGLPRLSGSRLAWSRLACSWVACSWVGGCGCGNWTDACRSRGGYGLDGDGSLAARFDVLAHRAGG